MKQWSWEEIQLHGGPWSSVWLEEMKDADMFFRERFAVWQETSAFICSNINMSNVVGNLSCLCGLHFSSQGWARDQDCLSRQHNVAPFVQMWTWQAALFESILRLFLIYREPLLSLCTSLLYSFSLVSVCHHVSLLDFGDECILFNLHFIPHPHSQVRMAPCGGGFSLKISKYLGNECK